MVLICAKRLKGKFLVIDLAGKLFARVPDAGSLPKTESLRIGSAKRADRRKQQADQKLTFSCDFSPNIRF